MWIEPPRVGELIPLRKLYIMVTSIAKKKTKLKAHRSFSGVRYCSETLSPFFVFLFLLLLLFFLLLYFMSLMNYEGEGCWRWIMNRVWYSLRKWWMWVWKQWKNGNREFQIERKIRGIEFQFCKKKRVSQSFVRCWVYIADNIL